ncbi:MAG: hypothetical protein C0604_08120, partial [Clostridiales bacterium]
EKMEEQISDIRYQEKMEEQISDIRYQEKIERKGISKRLKEKANTKRRKQEQVSGKAKPRINHGFLDSMKPP